MLGTHEECVCVCVCIISIYTHMWAMLCGPGPTANVYTGKPSDGELFPDPLPLKLLQLNLIKDIILQVMKVACHIKNQDL